MRLHRFYTKSVLSDLLTYTYEPHIHQWKNVFRYQVGQSVILFGDGFEHTYTIESLRKKEAALREQSKAPSRLQGGKLTLAIALIKRDNFELILQKCTEIGVTVFIPLLSGRSLQKMFTPGRLDKILIEATEQSGWGSVPELGKVQTIAEVVSKTGVVALDMSGAKISSVASLISSTLCIGPEGGWTDQELKLFKDKSIKVVSLPMGVMRAETAAIVSTGIILSQMS